MKLLLTGMLTGMLCFSGIRISRQHIFGFEISLGGMCYDTETLAHIGTI